MDAHFQHDTSLHCAQAPASKFVCSLGAALRASALVEPMVHHLWLWVNVRSDSGLEQLMWLIAGERHHVSGQLCHVSRGCGHMLIKLQLPVCSRLR